MRDRCSESLSCPDSGHRRELPVKVIKSVLCHFRQVISVRDLSSLQNSHKFQSYCKTHLLKNL
jgi:hypothetical protein